MIIGFFIGLCIGVVAAALVYWLLKSRIEKLLTALQNNQRRLQQLENEHEIRLRAATDQLQIDYEKQLAQKIEFYQDEQILQCDLLELEFETRLDVLQTAYAREREARQVSG